MFSGRRPPVLAYRMWARNVPLRTSRASVANALSSYAAIGRLWTIGVPSGSNTPSPTPSGSRRLCAVRLSGASTSQNVAATRCGAAHSPNSRHMVVLPHRQRSP